MIRFARTRHEYDSYRDYWELVRLAGFETCYVDEIRLDEPLVYIVCPINGEFRPHIENERRRCGLVPGVYTSHARVVWWNLERPDSGPGRLDQLLGTMVCNDLANIAPWVDAVWVSDLYLHSVVPDGPPVPYLFVPLGSHPGLALHERSPVAPRWDVCHLSYENDRRAVAYGWLRAAGLTLAPNGWGLERDAILRGSRLMVNVHQTPASIGSPLRFAVAAAYRMPLLTETLFDPRPLQEGVDLVMADYEVLVDACSAQLANSQLAALGENLYVRLCEELPFAENVKRAVEETLYASAVYGGRP